MAHNTESRSLATHVVSDLWTATDTLDRVARSDYSKASAIAEHAAEALDLAQQAVAAAVLVMRSEGASWSDVGAALGMSKQGAAQRFSRLDATRVEALRHHASGPDCRVVGEQVLPLD